MWGAGGGGGGDQGGGGESDARSVGGKAERYTLGKWQHLCTGEPEWLVKLQVSSNL